MTSFTKVYNSYISKSFVKMPTSLQQKIFLMQVHTVLSAS